MDNGKQLRKLGWTIEKFGIMLMIIGFILIILITTYNIDYSFSLIFMAGFIITLFGALIFRNGAMYDIERGNPEDAPNLKIDTTEY